jgi:UDP-2,3-diacylglucosamine pyrophosphatase LpxH
MRTLVISDLHLGSRTGFDVLRRPAALEALLEALDGVDRLVLLGDVVELRQAPVSEVLDAAQPVLEAVGAAMEGREVVVVAGNHDHQLVREWTLERGRALGFDDDAVPSPPGERLAAALGPARVRFAYPGIWLADDVYAMHGHYLDVHSTVPAYERLSAGLLARLLSHPPERDAIPDDYEAVLAPIYAALDAVAARATADRPVRGTGAAGKTWAALTREGRRPLRARAAALALPLAIAGLNRAGIGPVRAELSGAALRRGGLHGMREAIRRLGIGAPTVVFGHTHRAGPLGHDEPGEWAGLLNSGSWVLEPHYVRNDARRSPYWPGRAVELAGDGSPPVLRALLDDMSL